MKPKHIALFLFAVLLLAACAPATQTAPYYGRFLVGEEDIDEFSEIIRNNDIDYDYKNKLQTSDDSNAGMNMSAGEYAALWKSEMESQYEKLYNLLSGYVQSGEIDPACLQELSDAQTAFLESLKGDMIFTENTLGMGGDLSRMGTFGTVMINSNYASAYRQRTIDLMEYLYLITYHVEFVYQNNFRH
ncbi:MAG TPA: hypothetical protein PK854_09690 [Oscillospiraceae bacterium]|nr:hypothetical protein [Oscillospiraceae bacterium]HPS35524.1 hypothetical protein [Oscillospiraceae bacterium]